MKAYIYRHVVAFEETNLVGNVYYVEPIRWQGRCRELFLRDHAPQVLTALRDGSLTLVTLHCACDYLAELSAFDEVEVRMSLVEVAQNRIDLSFETWRIAAPATGGAESLVARGRQSLACMSRRAGDLVAVPIPPTLLAALEPYRAGG